MYNKVDNTFCPIALVNKNCEVQSMVDINQSTKQVKLEQLAPSSMLLSLGQGCPTGKLQPAEG